MNTETRRVRRLHLRASAEEDARSAATSLQDALSVASLPGADQGRLVIIRRLALGQISPRASPASLALLIERVARETMISAVPYNVSAAGSANAVVFADRSAAIIALADLHARGGVGSEWFWPRVVSGWQPQVSRAERWLLLLEAAHEAPDAAIVAAAITGKAVAAGIEDELISSIPRGRAAKWLRLEGWTGWTGSTGQSSGSLVPADKPAAFPRPEILRRWQREWSPSDDRLVWFGTMLIVQRQSLRAADARLPAKVAAQLAITHERAESERLEPTHRVQTRPRFSPAEAVDHPRQFRPASPPTVTSDAEARALDSPSAASGPASIEDSVSQPPLPRTPAEFTPAPDAAAPSTANDPRPVDVEPAPDLPQIDSEFHGDSIPLSGALTRCAGLLFLVPILRGLGFPEFLAENAQLIESGFPERLLWFIGCRAGMEPDDPLALQIEPIDKEPDGETAQLLTTWLNAVRRWSRRHARQGLIALIQRPGRLNISPTHIDVIFQMSQIDIRLRRLGLDVDPGWVPWLARVIRFHYLSPGEDC